MSYNPSDLHLVQRERRPVMYNLDPPVYTDTLPHRPNRMIEERARDCRETKLRVSTCIALGVGAFVGVMSGSLLLAVLTPIVAFKLAIECIEVY